MTLIERLSDDPLAALKSWLDEAIAQGLPEPTAMTLATATPDGRPSARLVLAKGITPQGVQFFTNYESRKAHELSLNPQASLVFFWAPLARQVRLEGTVHRLPRSDSEAYFATRPRGSQLGAWASPQSRELPDFKALERAFATVERDYADGRPVPCPPYWGGYVLSPETCEFWEGKASRLHDRIIYRRSGMGWSRVQIAP